MRRFIGLDVGVQTTTVAVVSAKGRQLGAEVVPTSARELARAVKKVPKPRGLCMEDGLLAEWLYQELLPHVDDLVVWNPMRKPAGSKSDRIDAYRAAEVMRINCVDRSVFKPAQGRFGRLRDLVKGQDRATKDLIRVKNQLHAAFRARGILTQPDSLELFSQQQRDRWMELIPTRSEFTVRQLFNRMDLLTSEKSAVDREVRNEAKRFPAFALLQTCPGIGTVRAAQLFAIIVTPHRFRTKRQLWAYSGLAVRMESSGDHRLRDGRIERRRAPMTRGLRQGNGVLKNVFKGAAQHASMKSSGEFNVDYQRIRAANIPHNLATLTIARKISATLLAMWKNMEEYSSEKHAASRK